MKWIWGCWARIYWRWEGERGARRYQTLLSSRRMPTQYSCYIQTIILTIMDEFVDMVFPAQTTALKWLGQGVGCGWGGQFEVMG